ncbi:hypothetical protein [Qaidamihabitans albus]|uniref:hypothetical protein n=1 Tax=Qaidamihabitans albus TaxID=2795733 RepID=UPI0018F275E8|nr:hypothetical protein [Qaidamihabitans albus]
MTCRRIAFTLLGFVLLAGLTACTQSKLDRDQPVTVSGTFTGPGGAPLPGIGVTLRAELTGAQALGGLGAAFASSGLVCAAEPRPALCRDDTERAGTDRDGAFRFELSGGRTQDSFGTARKFSLSAVAPPRDTELSGPVTAESFLIQVPDLDLGQVATWRPGLTVGAGNGSADIGWRPLPGAENDRVTFDDGYGAVVWQQTGAGRARFDARLLEGFSGGVSVLADARRPGPDTEIETRYRSPRLPYRSTAAPPLSRGADCVLEPRAGKPEPPSPCALTDGDLEPAGLGAETALVDLGRRVPLSLLAVRGCPAGTTCTVERSPDGRTWSPLATVNEGFASVEPVDRPSTRYLRISASSGLLRLAEVSAWDDTPAGPATLAVVPPDAIDAPRTAGAAGESGIPWPWIGVGVGALIVTALSIGLLLRRRRRR